MRARQQGVGRVHAGAAVRMGVRILRSPLLTLPHQIQPACERHSATNRALPLLLYLRVMHGRYNKTVLSRGRYAEVLNDSRAFSK